MVISMAIRVLEVREHLCWSIWNSTASNTKGPFTLQPGQGPHSAQFGLGWVWAGAFTSAWVRWLVGKSARLMIESLRV